MLNDSVNIEKHIKTYVLNTYISTENAKFRKIKHHKHLCQLTQQFQLYTIIIQHMNNSCIDMVFGRNVDNLSCMNARAGFLRALGFSPPNSHFTKCTLFINHRVTNAI
jgi:hypothetical protein